MMGDGGVKQILAKPIQLADLVTKLAENARYSRQECSELKSKTERLADLLRQAARADLYERPARRIMDDTEQVLDKALILATKCRADGLVKRVFTIIPPAAFKKMFTNLDNSIGNVSWLLRVSTSSSDADDDLIGLPPIAQNDPIFSLIWGHVAALHTGSPDARSDSATELASLARSNDRFAKLIIEEEGVGPLLRLVKEGQPEAQENAALAVGLLCRNPESVDRVLHAGVCSAFTKVLKDGPMRVQAAVAWAVAELAANQPKCQDLFAQNSVVRLLVSHLAFEIVQEHSRYSIVASSKPLSIPSLVLTKNPMTTLTAADSSEKNKIRHPNGIHSHAIGAKMHSVVQSTIAAKSVNSQHQNSSNGGNKGRQLEDPITKTHMKAMAAKALWQLAKENPAICKSITESRALLCFAALLEKGSGEVQYYCAMALMEIARVAERDADLRRSAFKPNSLASQSVVNQLLRIIQNGEFNNLLVPCITALGCLSRTFRATETRMIAPLVNLLNERESIIAKEATIALTKFACTENYLHVEHSKAIIEAGGAPHLVQLAYLGEQVQIEALVLLCYVARHVPGSEELAQAGVLDVLAWASKQVNMVQDPRVDSLLPEAKGALEVYQSRGSRGFH